ncbi:MAG: VOC family protein [Gammaproteobacteria bacterium]|nr:VOC family protein [Gammaproteobacteria bacterium]
MSNAMKQHGAFSWNELMTTDVDGAKAFYGKMFGWVLEDMESNGIDYTMAKKDGKEVAGIMATPPESGNMPPMWGAYVTVDDVESSARQAEELGGKIMLAPQDIPDVGRFCVISDPQGASLMLITYVDTISC